MRFTEFKFVRSNQRLDEGYTAGDLAETAWGAAVAAAFEKFPAAATESDIVRIIKGLQGSGGNLDYKNTRDDGLKSELTDTIVFSNIINMKAHIADIQQIESSIKKISKELPGILQDANNQVKTLDLKTIFANGKADTIQVGAQGGADQKGTKVDVSIIHSVEGQQERTNFGYSLKTDTSGKGIMPVSQAPGVDKGKGGQVQFFKGLGIIGDEKNPLTEPAREAYDELNDKLRKYVEANAKDGKLESVYEKEIRMMRRENGGGEVGQAFTKNVQLAADKINEEIKTDGQEAAFLNNLVSFFEEHINKKEKGIKLLTFDAEGAYTSTVEQFAANVRNFTLSAETKKEAGDMKKLLIYATNTEGKKTLLLEIRLKFSGGRFSGSTYRAAVKKGKDKPSGYELLRYTISVSTGPGYKQIAKI